MRNKINQLIQIIKLRRNAVIVYLLAIVTFVVVIASKNNYSVDELNDLIRANNVSPNLEIVDGQMYVPKALYTNNLYVSTDRVLDIEGFWNNQKGNDNPPLYYVLVRLLCSVTPRISVAFQTGIINLIFGVIALIYLRKIMYLFGDILNLGNKRNSVVIDIVSIMFLLLPGTINCMSLLRMYVMAMAVCLADTYYLLKLAADALSSQVIKRDIYSKLLLGAILASLTHYYSFLYVILANISIALLLAMLKCKTDSAKQLLAFAMGAFVGILCYPQSMLLNFRSKPVADRFSEISIFGSIRRIRSTFINMSTEMFGGLLLIVLVAVAVYKLYLFFRSNVLPAKENEESGRQSLESLPIFGILIPCVVYSIILGWLSPNLSSRYLYPIYGVLYVGIVEAIIYGISNVYLKKNARVALVIITLAIMVAGAYKEPKWEYLYIDDKLQSAMKDYKDIDVIVVYRDDWKLSGLYKYIEKNPRVTFIKQDEYELLKRNGQINNTEAIIMAENEDVINQLVDEMRNIDKSVKIGTTDHFNSYHIYRE